MRWLTTRPVPDLEEHLSAHGHAVISEKTKQLDHFIDPDFTGLAKAYPIRPIALEAQADVVVIVDPVIHLTTIVLGYDLAQVKSLRGRGVVIVGYARDDIRTWAAYTGHRIRACVAKPQHFNVYATNHQATAVVASRLMRAVWMGHPEGKGWLIEAVSSIKKREMYRPAAHKSRWTGLTP